MYLQSVCAFLLIMSCVQAWRAFKTPAPSCRAELSMSFGDTMKKLPKVSLLSILTIELFNTGADATMVKAPWNGGVEYEVIQTGKTNIKPKVGENVAIRFKGSYKGFVFDDTFSSEQPYFYRLVHHFSSIL